MRASYSASILVARLTRLWHAHIVSKRTMPVASYLCCWVCCAGPAINWKPGRSDKIDHAACPEDGRLPDGAKGAPHIRDVFYRMGFNDQEIVALSGWSCS